MNAPDRGRASVRILDFRQPAGHAPVPAADPLLDALPLGVVLLTADGRVRQANAAAARLLDSDRARLLRLEAFDLTRGMTDEHGTLVEADDCPLQAALRDRTSQPERVVGLLTARNARRWVRLSVEAVTAGPDTAIVCGLADVTDTRALQHRLSRQALTDDLTGLANRAGLDAGMQRMLAEAERTRRPLAMLVMDLDGFKHVNDTLGHVAGDALLVAVSERLRAEPGDGDLLARRGGDEFVLLLQGGAGQARDVAERLRARLSEPFTLAGQEVFIGASVGAALHPEHAREAERLFQLADAAMYAAKRQRRGFVLHAADAPRDAVNRLALDAQLRRAVEQRQFVLHYQPRFEADGRLAAVEALIRWQHPERGLVMPGAFIELAEETGLIVEIGRWVLEEACRQAAAWQRPGRPPLRVSVNVSARQFSEEFFRRTVPEALAASGLDIRHLELEITETTMMDARSDAALPALNALRAQGLRVLLDDFGTGYSSLSYLHRFPLDGVKIDRGFVQRLPAAPEAAAIVNAILGIAGALGLEVIAEGVETPAQRDFLIEAGCRQLQGWLLSKAVTPAVMSVLLSIGQG